MKTIWKDRVKGVSVAAILFVLFSVIVSLLFLPTQGYKLDNFAYQINDYTSKYPATGLVRPYVKVESKEKRDSLYNDLLLRYYYSEDSGSIRQYLDNDFFYTVGDETINLRLYSQSTFSITNTLAIDGGYRIDNGLFHAYFSSPELGDRGYAGPKYGCDSYVFINDVFADVLCEVYGLPKNEESYLKIVKNEEYGILPVTMENGQELTLSINDIIYSDKRTGPRCSQFNPYFGLVNFHYISKYAQPCIEIDLKSYARYIVSVLDGLDDYGYTVENTTLNFFTYDFENEVYVPRTDLDNEYIAIRSTNTIVWDVAAYLSLFLCFFLYSWLFVVLGRNDFILSLIVFVCEFVLTAIYSTVTGFVYTYYGFSLFPLLVLIFGFLFVLWRTYAIFEDRLRFKNALGRRRHQKLKV